MKQTKMKRKRRDLCPSPILDEEPKRTKVHAQRKFAQGSNVNSPVITPVKEFERVDRSIDLSPEPVELLPIQRPNTEDFLTFLCFRGTPLLPPNLNFFNTASIVDTNGQVHEIKSESPKNGPIDTAAISKGGSGSSERPFIAFGVRKRADPIVISRQMEKKRRHALALQALRRKYQEQKMAKIRAVTISKLSEKPSNKTTPVRSSSVTKIEKIQAPPKPPIQKPKVISSKHIKVTPQTVRNMNAKMKPKMCLRSFRGRFIQQELPFRPVKQIKLPEKIIAKKPIKKEEKKRESSVSNRNEKKASTSVKQKDVSTSRDIAIRVTRSKKIPLKPKLKGKQIIKRRILLPNTTTLVKSRVLRSQSSNSSNIQARMSRRKGSSVILDKLPRKLYKKISIESKKVSAAKLKSKEILKKPTIVKKVKDTRIMNKLEKSDKLEMDTSKPVKRISDRVLRTDVTNQNVGNKVKTKDTKQGNASKKDVEKADIKKDKKNVEDNESFEDDTEKSKTTESKKSVKKGKIQDKCVDEPKTKDRKQSHPENSEQKLSQRPSRKTKEAAAIYMEILSHKLVNDKKMDDDNISIDSFPELPNVKRTEQRENELKAKASKSKGCKRESKNNEKKTKEKVKIDETFVKTEKTENVAEKTLSANEKLVKQEEAVVKNELSRVEIISVYYSSDSDECLANIPKRSMKNKEAQNIKKNICENIKTEPKKEELPKLLSDSDDECLANLSKYAALKKEEELKRQTRNVSMKSKHVDSDDSFQADVEIPRKKQVTRSLARSRSSKISVTSSMHKSIGQLNVFSDTDDCKGSSISSKKKGNKKIIEKKESKDFSDSDEEPLLKFTVNKKEEEKTAEKLKEDILRKQKALIESPPLRTRTKKASKHREAKEKATTSTEDLSNRKPKRECAKRPSNYLPMFSSSDDEEKFFCGFSSKIEKKNETSLTSLDFLSKDLGRRFGKEKVNMSNEQIEKWLKDSAMAGNDNKKEEDLTICQEIPTGTSQEITSSIDTENLKLSLLETKISKEETTPEKKPSSSCGDTSKSSIYKSPSDRRPIFTKKAKLKSAPAIGAFSAKNESSIYAFEEEVDAVSTPFRRPARRPSSTATSRSEDESKSEEHSKSSQFRKPILRNEEQKMKTSIKVADFPCNGPGELVEAPTFYPTEKEFQDPLEYIEKISHTAEQFGVCRIVPPSTFKPECKMCHTMRFTSYNQYVHKMSHRWGPNFKEYMAIRKYLLTQNINWKYPPCIGGMEVDLPRLYQTVQKLGGLKEVIEKEKWPKVSDMMRIPKSAQDRVTKLDDIYCTYILPYDTLSPDEREELLEEVETAWAKRESKTLSKMQQSESDDNENDSESDDNDIEECITRGRGMSLNDFHRIARNTMSMWFRNTEPSASEIEQDFWKHVVARKNHICVLSGSIDSGSEGYGFAVSKNSPFARHSWNLKVLTNNSGSVLRSLGPVMGVTVPTIHVGMVYSACCWYRDPHSLPWIEYLHTGGKKIWYGIPNSVGDLFRKALTKLVPSYCRNKGIWLPSDTVMLPPNLLIESGVSLSRIVQEPGQFIVVFPKAFTSSISTGYVVSESVFFAPPWWLKTAQITFDLLKESCEPSMFSLDRLYLSMINDQRTSVEILKQMIPVISAIAEREKTQRDSIKSLGVTNFEVLPLPDAPSARRKKKSQDSGDYECEICRTNLFISLIEHSVEQDDHVYSSVYCLEHACEKIVKKTILSENCKLLYTYSEEELAGLVAKINSLIEQKLQKKVFNKFSGMPTLLNK